MIKVEKCAIPVAFFSPVKIKSATVLYVWVFPRGLRGHQPWVLAAGPRDRHYQRLEGGLWQPDCGTGMPCSLEEMLREEGVRVGLGGGYQPQPGCGQVGQELVCNAARPCGEDWQCCSRSSCLLHNESVISSSSSSWASLFPFMWLCLCCLLEYL